MEDADTSLYLSGAKSMAEGHGYRFVAYAGTPRITIVPPLQSAYLAGWWKAFPSFPDNLDPLYAGMILLALATFGLAAVYWRREAVPLWTVLSILAIWGVAVSWVFVIYWFLSDVLFGLLWILLAWHWRSADALRTARWWGMTGFLLAFMFLTRTAALAAVAAVGVAALFNTQGQRWRNCLACGLPVATAMAGWTVWTAGNHNYGTLIGFFEGAEGLGGVLRMCGMNLSGYLSGNTFLLGLAPALSELISVPGRFDSGAGVMLVLLVQGAGLCWMGLWTYGVFGLGSRTEKWLAFVVIAYLIEVGLWPYDFSTRGGFPVLPILVPWAWRAGAALAARWRIAGPAKIALASLAIALFATNLRLLHTRIEPWRELCRFDELREIADWMRQNTPADAVVASTWTLPNLYFNEYSGRRIVTDYLRRGPNWEPVSHATQDFIQADYVLTSWKWDLNVPKGNKCSLVKSSSRNFYRLHRVVKDEMASARTGDGVAGNAELHRIVKSQVASAAR